MANNPYVNKVQLADGTSLIDISSDTVTADKLMQGYTAHDRTGALITGTATGGGGGEPAPKKQINFIDYDGTIVESYTATEWQSVTALPSNPSHTGLTAQGWNWTKAQIDAQLTAMPDGDVWVGQMYVTTSGDTEIDVHFADSARLSPYLSCAVNGEITIDWGDNSTSTVTGTSLTTRKNTQHVYASAGDYTITIHVKSGSWSFYGTTTYTLLNKNNSTANANKVYSNCVQNVRIGSGAIIGNYAFNTCYSLESVTIPNGITDIGNYAFNECYSLASVTMPSSMTSININAFYSCYSLASISIPSGLTNIGNYAFYDCRSLESVTIPSEITNIGTYVFYNCRALVSVIIPSGRTDVSAYMFYNCYSLSSVTLPATITSIGGNAFYSCYGVAEYHIKPTTPPTLGAGALTNVQSDCVIYVPSASLETYKTASNWSTFASKMQGE